MGMGRRLSDWAVRLLTRREAPPQPQAALQRIAVVRLNNIGDVVTATGLLNALRERYPHAAITVITNPAAAPLLTAHPAVDRVATLQDAGAVTLRRPLALLRAALRLRRAADARMDTAFFLEQGPALLLAAALPARFKAGFAAGRGQYAWMLTHRVVSHGQDARQALRYRYRLYQDLLARFTGETEIAAPTTLHIPGDPDKAAQAWLRENGVTRPFVVLAPGGTAVSRRWPAENFRDLACRLGARADCDVVVLGGPAEADIAPLFEDTGAVNGIGALGIATTAAVIARAKAVVVNDTSLMHMAVALQTRTLAIFGGSPAQRAGYEPEKMTALAAGLSCQPCGLDICPYGEVPPCLSAISPETVLAQLPDPGQDKDR